MPTIQKPSLDHEPFDWGKDLGFLRTALERNRMTIFRQTGFDAEVGGSPDIKRAEEGDQLLDEIAGMCP